MASRPRIGILMDAGGRDEGRVVMEIGLDYPASVIRAGGLPLLLSWTRDPSAREEMIAAVDGLIVPGGRDIDPKLYGRDLHPETKMTHPDRMAFDFAMLSLAQSRQMPVLGICLGCQVMNVHRKGTLHQHLPDVSRDLDHRVNKDRSNRHAVTVRAGTKLAETIKLERLEANSRHHQAIEEVGEGLQVTASAPDGVIEAVEDPSLPFWVAVQWHPENLAGSPHERLFDALISAAGAYRNRKNG